MPMKSVRLTLEQVKAYAEHIGFKYVGTAVDAIGDKGHFVSEKGKEFKIRQMFAMTYSAMERGAWSPYTQEKKTTADNERMRDDGCL